MGPRLGYASGVNARRKRDPSLPAAASGVLYRYTSYDALIKIVSSRTMWASDIHYLNDGSEFDYALRLVRKRLDTAEQQESERKVLFDAARAQLSEVEDAGVFAVSFSANGDLLSQWRAYCPASRGVCVGVQSWRLADVCAAQGFTLVECIYSRDVQEQLTGACVAGLIAAYDSSGKTEHELNGAVRDFAGKVRRLAPQLKDPSFAEEQEWRLVSDDRLLDRSRLQFRQGTSFIVPYVEFRLRENDGFLEFDEVIVGPAPHDRLAMQSLAWLLHVRRAECHVFKKSEVPYRPW